METNAYTPIDFNEVNKRACGLAEHIVKNYNSLINLLTEYESHEVAIDEIGRTLDILTSLSENKDFFVLRIGSITTFLPRNQPLYALTCFVFVPALMASEVHFRVPHGLKNLLPKLIKLLNLNKFTPNLFLSTKERIDFLKERSALLFEPEYNVSRPVTDVVIFTGTSVHADQLRTVFCSDTLFIANGAGHNPIIVTDSALIEDAVEATIKLTTYNQGQDCAAPNSILVHKSIFDNFLSSLEKKISQVKIGTYKNPKSTVGPISDPLDIPRVTSILVENHEWISSRTPGKICVANATIEPTIIVKPLEEGGNYNESFAPIIFVQKYLNDEDLRNYFENDRYAHNAMYITLYGHSHYIDKFIGKAINGKVLHNQETIIRDSHLHAPGVERGTKPYGGYGYGASSVSIYGVITPKPTLPQRDIYEYIVKPILSTNNLNLFQTKIKEYTKLEYKKVEKLLKLRSHNQKDLSKINNTSFTYIDLDSIRNKDRYVPISEENVIFLIKERNVACIQTMTTRDLDLIRVLKKLYEDRKKFSKDDFTTALYAIAKRNNASKKENLAHQLHFFKNVYQLLFGKEFGPRLNSFLWIIDDPQISFLLDV